MCPGDRDPGPRIIEAARLIPGEVIDLESLQRPSSVASLVGVVVAHPRSCHYESVVVEEERNSSQLGGQHKSGLRRCQKRRGRHTLSIASQVQLPVQIGGTLVGLGPEFA